jgi:hypothetical protein
MCGRQYAFLLANWDKLAQLLVLRQNSIGAILCGEPPGVALFLPFGCTKAQQTAAGGGTRRRSKISGF